MVFRWKDAKFNQNGIVSIFLPRASRSSYYSKGKNSVKNSFFSPRSHKNTVIKVFWHAEFISALKIKLNPTVFEKNAKKIKQKSNYYFLFFVIFSKSYLRNCIKNNGIMVFTWKEVKFSQNGIDQFFGP